MSRFAAEIGMAVRPPIGGRNLQILPWKFLLQDPSLKLSYSVPALFRVVFGPDAVHATLDVIKDAVPRVKGTILGNPIPGARIADKGVRQAPRIVGRTQFFRHMVPPNRFIARLSIRFIEVEHITINWEDLGMYEYQNLIFDIMISTVSK